MIAARSKVNLPRRPWAAIEVGGLLRGLGLAEIAGGLRQLKIDSFVRRLGRQLELGGFVGRLGAARARQLRPAAWSATRSSSAACFVLCPAALIVRRSINSQ